MCLARVVYVLHKIMLVCTLRCTYSTLSVVRRVRNDPAEKQWNKSSTNSSALGVFDETDRLWCEEE